VKIVWIGYWNMTVLLPSMKPTTDWQYYETLLFKCDTAWPSIFWWRNDWLCSWKRLFPVMMTLYSWYYIYSSIDTVTTYSEEWPVFLVFWWRYPLSVPADLVAENINEAWLSVFVGLESWHSPLKWYASWLSWNTKSEKISHENILIPSNYYYCENH